MTDLSLILRLMGQDVSASRTLSGVGATAKKTEGDLVKLRKAALGALGGATFIAAAGAAIKGAGAFQGQLTLLSSAAGESQANLGLVGSGIRKISNETGESAHNLAEGMYLIEKASYRGADGLNVLHAAAEGARAENVDMATMTGALTSVMKSYHLKASDAVRATNELVAASGAAKTTMQDFAGSLSTVLPIASSAHISFAQVGGAIAALTQHGTSAQEATFELANTIRSLSNPNHVAQAEMQQLGIDVNDLSTGMGKRGLTGTLDMVYRALLKHGDGSTVLLNSFKQSKTASADLQLMIGKMPGPLSELSKKFLDGSVSMKQYQAAVKQMGADGYAMGAQFLALTKTSHGFNDLLKSGSPAAQTFNAALAKMMGGSTGLNTALQLTGENMGGFLKYTEEISEKGKQGGKDISTWAQTSQNFDVVLSRATATVTNFAQTTVTDLMPAITGALNGFDGVLNIVGELPHGFSSLALEAGLAAVVFPKLSGAVSSATTAVKDQITYARVLKLEMSDTSTRGQALGTMFKGLGGTLKNVAGVGGMVALADGAQHANTTLGQLEIVGGAVATGFATGGPWGAALGGAVALLTTLSGASDRSGQSVGQLQAALQKTHTEQAKAEVDALRGSLDNLTGAYGSASRAAVEHGLRDANGNLLDWVQTLTKDGVSLGRITDALMGNKKAVHEVDAAFAATSQKQIAANKAEIASLQAKADAVRRNNSSGSHSAYENIQQGAVPLEKQINALKVANASLTEQMSSGWDQMRGKISGAVAAAQQDAIAVHGIAKAWSLTKQQQDQIKTHIEMLIHTNTPETTATFATLVKAMHLTKDQMSELPAIAQQVVTQLDEAAGKSAANAPDIGAQWSHGFAAGITNSQSDIAAAAQQAADAANRSAKGFLNIRSPSRKTHDEIGVPWSQGVALGIKSQKNLTISAATSLMDSVLAHAKDKLKADVAARGQFAASFAQGFQSSVFGQQFTDTTGNAVKPSVGMILGAARNQASTANDVNWDTIRLTKLGLSPSLIKQMQSAGASGLAEMDELARHASKANIASLNHYDVTANAALNAAGHQAASAVYDKQIAADRSNEVLAQKFAKALADELRGMHRDETITVVVGGETIRAAIRKDQKQKGQKVTV